MRGPARLSFFCVRREKRKGSPCRLMPFRKKTDDIAMMRRPGHHRRNERRCQSSCGTDSKKSFLMDKAPPDVMRRNEEAMICHARKAVMSARGVSHGCYLTGIRFTRPRISEGMQDGRDGERFRRHERAVMRANDEVAGATRASFFVLTPCPQARCPSTFLLFGITCHLQGRCMAWTRRSM